jgi:hypothetical protein
VSARSHVLATLFVAVMFLVGCSASSDTVAETYRVDQHVKDGGFVFSVIGSEVDGGEVRVTVTVANHSARPRSLNPEDQKLVAGDQEFQADQWSLDAGHPEEMAPGDVVIGVLVFGVPQGTDPEVVELHDSKSSQGVRIDLTPDDPFALVG